MKEVPLTLDSLKQLDFGKISAAFDAERQHIVKDCMDRPHDPKARVVTIKFLFAPEQCSTGFGAVPGDVIKVGCEITSSVPKRSTQVYTMKPTVRPGVTCRADCCEQAGADRHFWSPP